MNSVCNKILSQALHIENFLKQYNLSSILDNLLLFDKKVFKIYKKVEKQISTQIDKTEEIDFSRD